MGKLLIDVIDEVIDLLEDLTYEAYTYDKSKIHFIDKYSNIDFQAKLGYNNYYFKDNINGVAFYKTKKFLDDETTIQQMLVDEGDEKYFYSYLERNENVQLINLVRKEDNQLLTCSNFNVLNKDWKEILEYADEEFDIYADLDEIEAMEIDEDEELQKQDEGINDLEDDDENDNNYDYEYNQMSENLIYGLSEIFEENSINDYQTYVIQKEENEEKEEQKIPQEDLEYIEEIYSNFKLIINNEEIEGLPKYRIIGDCEAAVDERAFDSYIYDNAVIKLRSVLEALHEREETSKNNELEK